ncbi:phage tail protein [Streptomyces sp. NPDC047981]|uniref:phage tail protein n=1 Tax=Streptomyces sp. NPDC047981 TaxID=3154610 RepID=UPI003445DF7F
MRAAVEGLGSPYSLVQLLPAVYQDDPFTVRLTAGWDDVIAPVINTLDCIEAYVDPWLTPADFLVWLADRMGTQLDEDWPLERKRAATAHAVQGHRTRGTVGGLRSRVALAAGGEVELLDSGGVFTSAAPETPFPEGLPSVAVIRIIVEREQDADLVDLEALVQECVPAHVPYRMEVVRR